jgi:hypothetical protein
LQNNPDMTTTATVVFRGLFNDALACTRCGSDSVFPAAGPFGALGALIGLERHLCRPCGRPFWAKTNAEYTGPQEPESEDVGELLTEPAEPVAFEIDVSRPAPEPVAFEIDVSHPEPEPVDLLALDAEFERRCAAAKQPRRRSRRRPAAAKTS